MATEYGFFINSKTCSGCKACVMACKDKNNLEKDRKYRRVYEITGGDWVKDGRAWISGVFAYNVSLSCNHCEKPVCADACPTKALYKREDGIVDIDPAKCIGCRLCEMACPYGAPQYDQKSGKMTKCDFCADYIDKSLPPACVAACPVRGIEFGAIEELREKYGDQCEIFPLPKKNITKPNLTIRPHKNARKSDSRSAFIANKEEV